MGFFDPSSWDDPFEDVVDLGKSAIDAAADAARAVAGVAEIIGDGVTDVAETIGEGVVTAGEATAKWSINAAGDVVDWSKTSFADVAEWTENAAGDVAGFTVEAYEVARDGIEKGAIFLYEQLANYFSETLPVLGAIDPKAREVAVHLLSEPVADGIRGLADTAGCVVTLGIKLKALSSVSVGIYVCGEGWGFYVDSGFDSLQSLLANPSLTLGVSAQVTMVFGSRSRASGAKAIKFGVGVKSSPATKLAATIGGVVLFEASMPPLFLGLRYAMDLDLDLFGKKQVGEPEKLKWKVKAQLPKPNGELLEDGGAVVEIGWGELTTGLSGQAANFDAAARAHADPASADRIKATALASSMSSFKPRYFGGIRTGKGLQLVASHQGALAAGVPGDRATFCVVSGLTDPTGVSLEAVGDPSLYVYVAPDGGLKLVPHDRTLDLTRATFRMVRGLTGTGVAFAVASDGPSDPRFLIHSKVWGDMVLPTASFRAVRKSQQPTDFQAGTTFLLDRPEPQPDALSPILRPGQFLRVGDLKRGPNGMYALTLASNGRLAMCERGKTSLAGQNAWLVYVPGMIQDGPPLLWAWASPTAGAVGAYHMIVTQDGRIAVRGGADPTQAGALLWQSEVRGAPGPCFLAVSNQGVALLLRGAPEAPGEVVWSSSDGPLYWPTRRRQVVLQAPAGFVRANNGGGVNDPTSQTQPAPEPVRVGGAVVGGWEAFELQDLCTGQVALRAQGRRFVGVADGGVALTAWRDQVGPRELFTLEVVGDAAAVPQTVRLRSAATGQYVGVAADNGLRADRDLAGATGFKSIAVDEDLTAHAGRPVHLIARHSGKALEVPGGIDQDGRNLTQREMLGAEHQKWCLTHRGGGWFSFANRQTGKLLTIHGGSTADLALATGWPDANSDNQRFALTPTGDGHYLITAKHSGKVLDVEASSQVDGGRVLQFTRHGGPNQQWRVELAPANRSSNWTALGGGVTHSPGIASMTPGRLDIFVRGSDQAIWQMAWEGKWLSWISHQGGLLEGPSVTSRAANRLDVFARGNNNMVFQRSWDGAKWSGWVSLGGGLTAAPVTLTPRPGRWDIFGLAPDKAIWHRYFENGWSGWVSLGGGLLDAPAAVWRDGRYDLFARGVDACPYQKTWQNGQWGPWVMLGDGPLTGPLTAVSGAAGCLDVFGRNAQGVVWRSFRGGAWGPWTPLQGGPVGEVAAIAIAADRLDIFKAGGDGALWHRRRTGSTWAPWVRLGLQSTGKPALASSEPGRIDVAVVAADNTLWHYLMR